MNGAQVGALRRVRVHRLVRQLHLWIGAWGAIAAILFGTSGFIQNHRGVLKLPQGESTVASENELPVPEAARATQELLRTWLRDVQHLNVDSQRARPGEPGGQRNRQSRRWVFTGGNARTTTQAEYSEGSDTITVRTSVQSPVAVLTRLHKGVGGGVAWILLTDSFALSMVALGMSGLVMWARGRSVRRMVLSVVGVAAVVVAVIGGFAVV